MNQNFTPLSEKQTEAHSMIGMKQKCLNIYHAKGEIKVKEKHTYAMYIVKLNSESCDTSKANQCGERFSS